jgi:hypothetical protein
VWDRSGKKVWILKYPDLKSSAFHRSGVYILGNTPPPPGGISADFIGGGGGYEKGKSKRWKMIKKNYEKGKKERVKKKSKWEARG